MKSISEFIQEQYESVDVSSVEDVEKEYVKSYCECMIAISTAECYETQHAILEFASENNVVMEGWTDENNNLETAANTAKYNMTPKKGIMNKIIMFIKAIIRKISAFIAEKRYNKMVDTISKVNDNDTFFVSPDKIAALPTFITNMNKVCEGLKNPSESVWEDIAKGIREEIGGLNEKISTSVLGSQLKKYWAKDKINNNTMLKDLKALEKHAKELEATMNRKDAVADKTNESLARRYRDIVNALTQYLDASIKATNEVYSAVMKGANKSIKGKDTDNRNYEAYGNDDSIDDYDDDIYDDAYNLDTNEN